MSSLKRLFRPVLAAAAASLLMIWSCRLANEEATFLEVQADSAWTRYDKILVVLADTAGEPLDTLFFGKLESVDQLKRLDGTDYDGGKVEIVITGFLDDRVAKTETRIFDGATGKSSDKIIAVIIPIDPSEDTARLDIRPDAARLYTGGPEATLSPDGSGWGDKTIAWSSGDPAVASVSGGSVKPVSAGKAWIKAVYGDQRDSSEITVVTDPPVLDAGGDTTILVGTPVRFGISARQEFGVFAMFKSSLDGDEAWEDSTSEIPPAASVLTAPEKTYAQPGTFTARFYVRDGEGNEATASRRVIVASQAPRITSLSRDAEIQAGDSVEFIGKAEVQPGTLEKYAWDYGDGSAKATGSLSSAAAEIAGGHRYGTAGEYTVSLTVEDNLGHTVARTVHVKVNRPADPDLPSIVSLRPGDTTVSIRDSLDFAAEVSAKAGLKSYAWDFDGDRHDDLTGSLSNTSATVRGGKRFASPGTYPVAFTVTDANGNSDTGTVIVTVLKDEPVAKAGSDTTVDAGTRVNLHGKASDGLGRVTKTEWKIGEGAFVAASPETSFTAPANGRILVCIFRVTDDDAQVAEDTVSVTVAASGEAKLAGLSISAGVLSPAFAPDVLSYAVSPADTIIAITATLPGGSAATIKVNGVATASGTASAAIRLPAGATTRVPVSVTAEDGVTVRTYDLSFTVPATGRPDLVFTAAAITSKTPTRVNYSYTIKNNGTVPVPSLSNVSIQNFYSADTIFNNAGDAAAGGAILAVNQSLAPGASYTGAFYASGAMPANLPYVTFKIDWGDTVKESDETNNTSFLLALVPPVADAGLDTAVAAGSAVHLHGKASDPVGSVAKTEWKIGAGAYTVAGKDTTFTAPAVGGSTLICLFRVTDDDGLVDEDTVLVTVSSSTDADLAALVPSTGSLVPAFSKTTTAYTMAVANGTTSIRFTPTVSNAASTVKVNGTAVTSGTASGNIALGVGANAVPVEVTAQSGLKKTYTVTVSRAGSSVNTLQALTASAGTLSPAFAAGTLAYTVNTSAASTTITPTVTAGSNATVKVNGVAVASGTASAAIALPAGVTTTVDIVVTPQDGSLTRTYSIGFTVPGSTLPDLIITAATITAVSSTRIDYSYTIKNNGGTEIPDLYNVSIQNFFSADAIFNNTGDRAGGGSILGIHKALAPGASHSGTFAAYVQVQDPTLTYVTWKIDWGDIIAESNENNNTVAMPIP